MTGPSMESPLVEGDDYYLELGLMVLTEAFLRRRGYCCESGCRHCPYGFQRGDGPRAPVPAIETHSLTSDDPSGADEVQPGGSSDSDSSHGR